MYAPQDNRTPRSKRSAFNPPPTSNLGPSGPTTFFLRSERDMEKSTHSRGRKMPQDSHEAQQAPSVASSSMRDSTFGVQSLEEAMSESLYSDSTTWSRGDGTEQVTSMSPRPTSPTAVKKRKVSYPPHPRAARPQHRDISSELPSTAGSSAASPLSFRSSDSPLRSHLRRASNSSINLNQPLTPLKLSPNPDSGMPTTPRSESVQSFRLSDDESCAPSETNSQVVHSSSGDDDDKVSELDLGQERETQLVMPSISMPARRPFTGRGRNMGRLKVMVVGRDGVGKTSLIRSIIRTCEDIVHVDPVSRTTASQSIETSRGKDIGCTEDLMETQASTRPYPLWWSDMESSRGLWRRKSFGEGILERNLSFIDTPGTSSEASRQRILHEIKALQLDNAQLDNMSENQLLNLFSGEGGTFVDAVLYLIEPGQDPITEAEHAFVRELASRTNIIPLIARADNSDAQQLNSFREKVRSVLSGINADWYSMVDISAEAAGLPIFDATPSHSRLEPFAISSALADDAETMDASLLMASDYLQPLAHSDLSYFLNRFFSPSNIARMRHASAKKFLLWRKEHLGIRIDLPKQNILQAPDLLSPVSPVSSPYVTTGAASMLSEQSKVLVPYSTSSYYRSASPSAASDSPYHHAANISTSAYALAQHDSQTTGAEPFRQIRLAKWAQELQRSLANERRRYDNMYTQQPAEWHLEHEGASDEKALISRQADDADAQRPTRGKLGGEIAVIDPLGILSLGQIFRRQSYFILRVAGGCSLVGAVAWWVLRNWAEVQEWFGGGSSGMGGMIGTPIAVPAPPQRAWWEGWVGL